MLGRKPLFRSLAAVGLIIIVMAVMMPTLTYAQDEDHSLKDFDLNKMRYHDVTREPAFERADWQVLYSETVSKFKWGEAGCKFLERLSAFGPGLLHPKIAAAAIVVSALSAAVDNSHAGSYKVVIQESMGERRYTIAKRRIVPSPDDPMGESAWVPLSTGEAAMALLELGYCPPDALWQQDISSSLKEFREKFPEQWSTFEEWRKKSGTSSLYPPDGHDGSGVSDGQTTDSTKELWFDFWQTSQLHDDLGGVDFTSIHLNYISEHCNSAGEGDFRFLLGLRKATGTDKLINLKDAAQLSAKSFLTGLAIPNNSFWVNLNPWEPERIVDEDVGMTDVGRIMLEADLQMKKDFCKYENPGESDIGAEYWELLDEKQEELVKKCMSDYPGQIEDASNVLFQAATRHWIVPDKITAYGDGDEIYVAEATLDIYSEPVHEHSTFEIVEQSKSSLSTDCFKYLAEAAKEYGRYAKEIEEELILPLVVEEVNNGDQYSDLRQVYLSLALAQWYKERFEDTSMFSDLIHSGSLAGLESEDTWSPKDIWEKYVKSYEEGEYNYEQETSYRKGNIIITETKVYTGGGVDFGDIVSRVFVAGSIPLEMKGTVEDTMNKLFVSRGDDCYFGDYLYASASTPGTQNWIKVVLALVILGIISGCYLWFYRKRIAIRRPKMRPKVPRKL